MTTPVDPAIAAVAAAAAAANAAALARGFTPTAVALEMRGRCQRCA